MSPLVGIAACNRTPPNLSPGATRSSVASMNAGASGRDGRWSDAATWGESPVPRQGADVVIPAGRHVILDVASPALHSLTVAGTLTVGGQNVALTTGSIAISGRLEAGSETHPYRGRFVITMIPGATDSMMVKGIVVAPGGALELHGEPRLTWTRLAATATQGATRLTMERAVDWRPGETLVVASTSVWQEEAELVRVDSVRGSVVALTAPLKSLHFGEIMRIAGQPVDERAEVGLLDRNIVIQGDSSSETRGIGAHVMILEGGVAHVDGVELYRAGQRGATARYPIHWHMAGHARGQYATRSSVWHSFNRCMTIHGTHDVLLEDNVCYDHVGHGYFLEDGVETRNVLRRNLGLVNHAGTVIRSDGNPSTFWVTNPDNTFENNAAAGSSGTGIWVSAPMHPTGISYTTDIWPFSTPMRRFSGNVVHSSRGDGIHIEGDPTAYTSYNTDYRPRKGATPNGLPVNAVFDRMNVYKNLRGWWSRGDHMVITNSVFADNRTNVQMGDAGLVSEGQIVNTLLVGHSPSPSGDQGQGTGFVLYDGPVSLDHVTFANYKQTAAIAPQPGFDGRMSARFTSRNQRFVDATRTSFPTTPVQQGERQVVLRDIDGSVTGQRGSTIVSNFAFALDSTCTMRADLGAHVCTSQYAGLWVADGAHVAPATVTREDGARYHFDGYAPTMLWFNGPTNHVYTVAPDAGFAKAFGLVSDGLPEGQWMETVLPVGVGAVKTYHTAAAHPRSAAVQVASQAELARMTQTAVYFDAPARTLHVRFVGDGGTFQWMNVEIGDR